MEHSQSDNHNDPFGDPAGYEPSMDNSAVLCVDRNATLSLGTDALIVLDEGLRHRRAASNFCGFLPQFTKTTRSIPYHRILWAQFSDLDITVHYTQTYGRKASACYATHLNYTITDKGSHAQAKEWVERLLDHAYPRGVMRKRRIKVLVNPFGGQGSAQKIWSTYVQPIFAAAQCEIDVEQTKYRGHAVEIAQNLDIEAYDVIACASGDGLPHEVFNGLAKHRSPKRALRKIAVCQIPCGSGNAMCLNLTATTSPSLAAVEIVKALRTPLDLVAITQGTNLLYSFLSQAVGIIAESDLGTDSLRWMGAFRFTWGFLVRILGKTIYPAELSVLVDVADKVQVRDTYCEISKIREAASTGHSNLAEEEVALPNADDSPLPPLKYGRVADELHSGFITADMPTLGNFYVGNMCYMSADAPFFVASLPSDGKMDLITIPGDIPRTTALRMLTQVEQGTLIDFPEVEYKKVLAYRIKPRSAPVEPDRRLRAKLAAWLGGAGKQTEGLIAIDGESIPFEPFQAEVVPQMATVLSKHGAYYGFDGRKLK